MSDGTATLAALWRERKGRFEGESPLPRHFGDPDAEARAARAGAVVLDRSERDFLRIRGLKARRMLQGQLSNEIAALAPGEGCYACHLDAKGRLVTDLVATIEAEDSVLLELEPGQGAVIARRFAPYAMLEDLEVEALSGERRLLVAGPDAAATLAEFLGADDLAALPAHAWRARAWQGRSFVLAARPETGERAYLVAGAEADLVALARELLARGLRPAGSEAWDILRIEAGYPVLGRDMDERNLPPECGIPHAISYTKGCYVGQETIARMRTYGQANKGLRGLLSATRLPVGAELATREGKVVGRVTSSSWSPHLERPIALGYVQRDHLAAGTTLIGRGEDEIFEVEVADLPLVPRRFAAVPPR